MIPFEVLFATMPSRRAVYQTCGCGDSFCLGTRGRAKDANVHKHGYLPGPWWWPWKPRWRKK